MFVSSRALTQAGRQVLTLSPTVTQANATTLARLRRTFQTILKKCADHIRNRLFVFWQFASHSGTGRDTDGKCDAPAYTSVLELLG